jgi:hypothetical protein
MPTCKVENTIGLTGIGNKNRRNVCMGNSKQTFATFANVSTSWEPCTLLPVEQTLAQQAYSPRNWACSAVWAREPSNALPQCPLACEQGAFPPAMAELLTSQPRSGHTGTAICTHLTVKFALIPCLLRRAVDNHSLATEQRELIRFDCVVVE